MYYSNSYHFQRQSFLLACLTEASSNWFAHFLQTNKNVSTDALAFLCQKKSHSHTTQRHYTTLLKLNLFIELAYMLKLQYQ